MATISFYRNVFVLEAILLVKWQRRILTRYIGVSKTLSEVIQFDRQKETFLDKCPDLGQKFKIKVEDTHY